MTCLELLYVLSSFHLSMDWSLKYLHKKCLNVNEGIAYKKVVLSCLVHNCCWFGRVYFCSCLVWVLLSYVYLLYYVCIAVFFTLDAGLLARSQYSEGPATGHLYTGFSWFPCV